MDKYYVYKNLNIQAGPQFDFSLHSVREEYTRTSIALGVGAGYDINANIFVEARYTFQLNDYYTGDVDITTKTNMFLIGVGCKLDFLVKE
jgi:opacity protein-like surface antigen